MITLKQLEQFTTYLTEAYSAPLPSVRKHRLHKLKQLFPEFTDFTISLALELPPIKLPLFYNYRQDFNFEKDFGEIIYYLVNNDDETLFKVLPNKNYYLQKYFNIILSKTFVNKFSEDELYMLLDHYYKLPEIISMLELPDMLSSDIVTIQSLSREEPEQLVFPIDLVNVPIRKKKGSIVYFVKNGNNIISNIQSSYIRNLILKNVEHLTYGVIGILKKEPGYKRKWNFEIIFFNQDYKYVINYYRGKVNYYDNRIEDMNYKKQDDLKKAKILKMNKEEFIQFIKKHMRKKYYVAMLETGLVKLKINVEYKNVKILDYWYDDDYNLQGLIVDVYGQPYKIKFKIYDTNYIYGIENKYVRVAINKIKDEIVNVNYISEVKQWSKQYNSCQICNKVDYKHITQGICSKCYNRLLKTCDELSGYYKEECNANFHLYTDKFEIIANGETIKFIPQPYVQLSLPLFEVSPCENN